MTIVYTCMIENNVLYQLNILLHVIFQDCQNQLGEPHPLPQVGEDMYKFVETM